MFASKVNPSISVIIPCYNYGKYLEETVESVLAQDFDNWECLIIDDGSTDGTFDISQEFTRKDKRIRYFYKKNGGLSDARNYGLNLTKGEFIQFLDADDLLGKNKFSHQVCALQMDDSLDLVYGKVIYFEDKTQSVSASHDMRDIDWMPKVSGDSSKVFPYLVKKNIMAVSCPLIRCKSIQNVGFFNLKLTSLEDWEYWLRAVLIHNFKIQFGENSGSETRVRVHMKSMSTDKLRMIENEYKIRKSMEDYVLDRYREFSCSLLNETKEMYEKVLHSLMFEQLYSGTFGKWLMLQIKYIKLTRRFWYCVKNDLYWVSKRISRR